MFKTDDEKRNYIYFCSKIKMSGYLFVSFFKVKIAF